MIIPTVQLLAASGTAQGGGQANPTAQGYNNANANYGVVTTSQQAQASYAQYYNQGNYSVQQQSDAIRAAATTKTKTKTVKSKGHTATHTTNTGPATVDWSHATGLTGQNVIPGQTGYVYAYPSGPNQHCVTYIPGYENNNNGTAPTTVPVCVERSAGSHRAQIPGPFRAMGSLLGSNGRK
ncbi:hypothetical protein SCHPADRAFT_887952 [Schizopora paradoxa]|uniref:Uncharacterized protein n=1 Tax=Schizopora paradoxa TaxID=27342 RepID=A0A0H2SGJ8_9AGAM|nr:hypothetical protein SCHPADRAFT_887952 [Schizopora paradoxa]